MTYLVTEGAKGGGQPWVGDRDQQHIPIVTFDFNLWRKGFGQIDDNLDVSRSHTSKRFGVHNSSKRVADRTQTLRRDEVKRQVV